MFRKYLVACSLMAAQLSFAQGMGAPREQVFVIPEVDQESLILQIPSKWYPYHRTTDAKVDTFMFPTGQEPSDWKEALQSEKFTTTLGVTSARQVYDFRTQGTNCIEHSVEITKEGKENGYSMAQWLETCVRDDDSEQVILVKTIVGNQQLYVINKIWKYQPRNVHLQEWLGKMDDIFVCDPTVQGHPCRHPNRQAGEGGRPQR